MPGDKRAPTRQDKKASSSASHRRADSGRGGGGDKIETLLAEARERTEAGKYGRAFASLKQILAADPNHQEALRLSATVHLKLGSRVAARAAFDSLVRKAMDQQDFPSAEFLLREYLAADARYVPFAELLGQVVERQGNSEEAVTEYGKAIDVILEDQDEELRSKADELYKKIQELAPNSPEVGRLRNVFAPSASGAPTIAAAVEQETPASRFPWDPGEAGADSASSGVGVGTAQPSTKPWEDQSVPAPFPWEVEQPVTGSQATPGASSAPPISTDSTTTASPPVLPPIADAAELAMEEQAPTMPEVEAPSAAPVPEFKFASEPEVPAAIQEDVVQEQLPPVDAMVESSLASTEEQVASPAFSVPEEEAVSPTFASEETAAVEPGSALSTYQEEPAALSEPTESASEPAGTTSEVGLRFASGPTSESGVQERLEDAGPAESALTWGTKEEVYTPPPAAAESFGEPVFPDSGSVDLAEAFADELAHVPEPTAKEKKPGRKARRKPASTSPTWAVPTGPGGAAKRTSAVDFFPTLGKLQHKIIILTRQITSSVRSFVMLCVGMTAGSAVLGFLVVVALSLTWIGTEEEPSTAFHNLRGVPPQGALDYRRNGYVVLRELGVTSSRIPVRAGEGRTLLGYGEAEESRWPRGFAKAAILLSGWYGERDPAAELRKRGKSVRNWSKTFRTPLSQYRRFTGKPIEDLGFGSVEGPDELYILGLHRLYVAEGFAAGLRHGVNRLERDLEAWRRALAKAKTLRLKMLAAEALNDDLAIASGLLARRGLNPKLVPTLAKMSRPLNHAERSLRWPMQNQFVLEVKMMEDHVKTGGPGPQPIYHKALTYFPLPEQKSLNAHAEYVEALVKHDSVIKVDGDPRSNMPELYSFARTPPKTLSDYVKNPIDNFLVQEPRVDWKDATGRILETEARMRLATLQARLRRKSLVRNPVLQIARAGQGFYDPFTGFPMLFNPSKTVLYSVGKDGSDNDGHPVYDLSVPLYMRKT